MSENPITPQPDDSVLPTAQGTGTEAPARPGEPVPATASEESTIGTGTSMALGCVAGTIVLIIFGLLFLFLSTLI